MDKLEEKYLIFAFFAAGTASIAFAFWLRIDPTYKVLVGALASISGIVAAGIALLKKIRDNQKSASLTPSALTPGSPILKKLMEGAVETVCRGVSVPQNPETAALSAFIFRLENRDLVCTHYWSPSPRKEQVGILRFAMSDEVAKKVIVVKAAMDKGPCRTLASSLVGNRSGITGEIDDINFVLATPILNEDGTVWGVVDFDSKNEVGQSLLKTDVSDVVMYNLARHLRLIFSLTETGK
jgi:hypothetical protein